MNPTQAQQKERARQEAEHHSNHSTVTGQPARPVYPYYDSDFMDLGGSKYNDSNEYSKLKNKYANLPPEEREEKIGQEVESSRGK